MSTNEKPLPRTPLAFFDPTTQALRLNPAYVVQVAKSAWRGEVPLYVAPAPAAQPVSDVTEAITRVAIDVEKLLCEKLGRQWAPSGMSIQTLIDDLAALADPALVAQPAGKAFTYSPQRGKPGHCFIAQVWGPAGESVASFDSTDDPAVASGRAAALAALLSAAPDPVAQPSPALQSAISQVEELMSMHPPPVALLWARLRLLSKTLQEAAQ